MRCAARLDLRKLQRAEKINARAVLATNRPADSLSTQLKEPLPLVISSNSPEIAMSELLLVYATAAFSFHILNKISRVSASKWSWESVVETGIPDSVSNVLSASRRCSIVSSNRDSRLDVSRIEARAAVRVWADVAFVCRNRSERTSVQYS